MAGSGGRCRLSELAFICSLGTGLHPWPWNWPSSAACWAGLRILCEMVTVRGRSEMVTPASNCSVEARTKLKMALWPHLDRLRRLTLVLGFSPQPLESLAWTFVPLTQRSGIQASCPGAPGEAWALLPTLERCQDYWPAPGSGVRARGPPSVRGAVPPPHPRAAAGSRGWILPEPAATRKPTTGAGAPRPPARQPLLPHAEAGPTLPSEVFLLLGERGRRGLAGTISLPHPHPLSCAAASGPLVSQKRRPHLNSKNSFKMSC